MLAELRVAASKVFVYAVTDSDAVGQNALDTGEDFVHGFFVSRIYLALLLVSYARSREKERNTEHTSDLSSVKRTRRNRSALSAYLRKTRFDVSASGV